MTVKIWDINDRKEVVSLGGYSKGVNSVSFSSDGCLLASKSRDGTVHIYRCDDWECIFILDEPAGGYWARLAFHPKDHVLSTLGHNDKMIRIWEYDPKLI